MERLDSLNNLIPEFQTLVSEKRLIANTLLRRQITDPMAKARLIARLKKLNDVKPGRSRQWKITRPQWPG